jgi:hypothetical protein
MLNHGKVLTRYLDGAVNKLLALMLSADEADAANVRSALQSGVTEYRPAADRASDVDSGTAQELRQLAQVLAGQSQQPADLIALQRLQVFAALAQNGQ